MLRPHAQRAAWAALVAVVMASSMSGGICIAFQMPMITSPCAPMALALATPIKMLMSDLTGGPPR